jgi:hypothetical protein
MLLGEENVTQSEVKNHEQRCGVQRQYVKAKETGGKGEEVLADFDGSGSFHKAYVKDWTDTHIIVRGKLDDLQSRKRPVEPNRVRHKYPIVGMGNGEDWDIFHQPEAKERNTELPEHHRYYLRAQPCWWIELSDMFDGWDRGHIRIKDDRGCQKVAKLWGGQLDQDGFTAGWYTPKMGEEREWGCTSADGKLHICPWKFDYGPKWGAAANYMFVGGRHSHKKEQEAYARGKSFWRA